MAYKYLNYKLKYQNIFNKVKIMIIIYLKNNCIDFKRKRITIKSYVQVFKNNNNNTK